MRILSILRRIVSKSIVCVHAKRRKALFFGVKSLLRGGKLYLTALGRSAKNRVNSKHNIKRIDRLVGNKHLHMELSVFFKSLCLWAIGKCENPLILADWTDLEGDFACLKATVPASGRSLPIYYEVHPKTKKTNRKVEALFLQRLAAVLPYECKPIIVADTGFKNPFWKVVRRKGWHYVGRLTGGVCLQSLKAAEWTKAKSLYRKAGRVPKDLRWCQIARSNPMKHRVILGKKVRRKRPRKKPRKHNRKHQCCEYKKRKQAKEPWLLVTSLDTRTASEIVAIYRKRMQIEETFRDAKSHRFGWSLEDAVATTAHRYAVLLLIATLATYAVTALGQVAEAQGRHRAYQANTINKRRVLSFFQLGRQILERNDRLAISTQQIRKAIEILAEQGRTILEKP